MWVRRTATGEDLGDILNAFLICMDSFHNHRECPLSSCIHNRVCSELGNYSNSRNKCWSHISRWSPSTKTSSAGVVMFGLASVGLCYGGPFLPCASVLPACRAPLLRPSVRPISPAAVQKLRSPVRLAACSQLGSTSHLFGPCSSGYTIILFIKKNKALIV